MTPFERAQEYIKKVPPAIAGQSGHSQFFKTASTLYHGFDLSESELKTLLDDYNKSCSPPFSDKDVNHKIRQTIKSSPKKNRGWLLTPGEHSIKKNAYRDWHSEEEYQPQKLQYDKELLASIAKAGEPALYPFFLSDRSPMDPALCDASKFLDALYYRDRGEKILCFSSTFSQGEVIWPEEEDKLPLRGEFGAWYLCQPVSGKWVENDKGKKSRRLESCITSWRYLLIESDEAPAQEWLAAIITLPLPIAAIYTSGKRSLHILIRVDASSKADYEIMRQKLRPILVTLGADGQAFKGAQLTRLPYHWRRADRKEVEKKMTVITLEKPLFQRLLYLNPNPTARPLIDAPVLRDTPKFWLKEGANWAYRGGKTDNPDYGKTILYALKYHRMSSAVTELMADFPELTA